MPPSKGSESPPPPAPRASLPRRSSPSHERSSGPLEASASRPAFEARCDLPVPLPVEVERRGAPVLAAHATNLSTSGVCLHLAASLPVGSPVLLRLGLPDASGVLTARGRVSWCEEPPPAAAARFLEACVRFEILSDADRDRIARFVRDCDPARLGPG